jgi:hypothetical protein
MNKTLQRVRYVKAGALLRSFRKFSVGTEEYLLEINPLNKKVYLLNAKDNSVVKEKEVKGGLHKMKIAARLLLEETGLPTEKENRNTLQDSLENMQLKTLDIISKEYES